MSREILKPYFWSIEELFKNVYDIPVYQRPYSWDSEQVRVLLNDILESYNSNKNEGYYVGNLIIYDKNSKINGQVNLYDVVDGQQRITTFSLILLAIYTIAICRNVDINDRTVNIIRDSLWTCYNRKNHKDILRINLNSIEKECFKELFDYAFDNPQKISQFCKKYFPKNNFEKRIINNFLEIYNFIDTNMQFQEEESLLLLAEYILNKIKIIAIEANCNEQGVFSMFESINSKGKKLEEIDLIKTYIFSNLNSNDYSTYLKKWGNLITNTKDNLYDYLLTYVKSFIKFYRQNMNTQNFKYLVENEMSNYYDSNNISQTLKCFLDDLNENVKYYNMLHSLDEVEKIIQSSKFKFYYLVFLKMDYVHPKPLFMRMLYEFDKGFLTSKDIENITKEIVSIMLKFITITGRDSKDIITMFSNIMNEIYKENSIDEDMIIYYISNQLLEQTINNEQLYMNLQNMDCFDSQKRLGSIILALYEATEEKEDGKYKTFYDKAFTLLEKYGETYSLDHLMVQKPNKENEKYYFYENNDSLILKEGNDFPDNLVQNGMNYSLFTKQILNRIGNLQYCCKDKNSSQGNSIKLKDLKDIYSFEEIQKRTKIIFDVVFKYCLPEIEIKINKITLNKTGKKVSTFLPKMDKLIENNIVAIGDKLYIKGHESDSIAILLDKNTVDFNGEILTLNQWGLKVTGWKSIGIYRNVIRVGEHRTLHERRKEIL